MPHSLEQVPSSIAQTGSTRKYASWFSNILANAKMIMGMTLEAPKPGKEDRCSPEVTEGPKPKKKYLKKEAVVPSATETTSEMNSLNPREN